MGGNATVSPRASVHRGWRWAGLAAAVAYCGITAHFAYTGYARRAQDPYALVGAVEIDLTRLQHRLQYGDLQAAGLFTGAGCASCDFSATGHVALFGDYSDAQFVQILGKAGGRLSLAFYYYGDDVANARHRVDAGVRGLQAKFPADRETIQLVQSQFRSGRRSVGDR